MWTTRCSHDVTLNKFCWEEKQKKLKKERNQVAARRTLGALYLRYLKKKSEFNRRIKLGK
jgi:hypothetical protein